MGQYRVTFWSLLFLLSVVTATGCDGGPATVTSPSIAAAPASATPDQPPAGGLPPDLELPAVNRIIWGRVLDYDTGQPIGGARVSLWQYPAGPASEVVAVTTTADGRFNLTAATRGDFWVKVERSGYEAAMYCCGFDFSGDLALKAYGTLNIRPGESMATQVFAEGGDYRCGDERFFWCRRVEVNASAGQPVMLEVSAADGAVVVTDDLNFANWTTLGAALTTSAREVWIVRFAFYRDPPLRVTLQAR